ncbi:MAG: hypothetical protein VKJ46_00330 [Leptolyngbyaceae bacterium]|nr:hypothetical protein [Leptolyngbyaceae bacterium]
MSLSDDALPLRKLDDKTLIQKFVTEEGSLLSNQNLRVEATFDALQLLARKEGVIATLKTVNKVRTLSLKQQSQFWILAHQVVIDAGFVPVNYADTQGLVKYEHYAIPAGYQMNYTEARMLWKEWWVRQRNYNSNSIQLDLLIFSQDKWYPIRDIKVSQGTVFIKTLLSEVVLEGSAQVPWLRRSEDQSEPNSKVDHSRLRQTPTPASGEGQAVNSDTSQSTDSQLPPPAPPPRRPRPNPEPGNRGHAPGGPPPLPANTRLQADAPPPRKSQPPELGNRVQQPAQTPQVDFSNVVQFRDGKLYIQTAIGEVMVEGSDFRFSLNPSKNSNSGQ